MSRRTESSNGSADAPPNASAPGVGEQAKCERLVKETVSAGHLLVAIETAREGLLTFRDSVGLQQQLALALVQTGALTRAREILADLVGSRDQSEETLCLLGRVYKEMWR